MSDAPVHAGDDFSDEHYDLVVWEPVYREWVPHGYSYTREQAKAALVRKRGLPGKFLHRAVKVQTITRHIDVTDEFDNEETQP